jgi:hypothetical protein
MFNSPMYTFIVIEFILLYFNLQSYNCDKTHPYFIVIEFALLYFNLQSYNRDKKKLLLSTVCIVVRLVYKLLHILSGSVS